ncbi:PIN domain-containing protein [Streptomyces rubiginosohelvolus]|uniref:hypothetical protein n=1 Tax=Streptomyces rubiginosohelvolus TaxID=67362 RepID=UPI0036CF97AE
MRGAGARGCGAQLTPHGVRAGRLPMVHRDPFERLLIAQSQAHRLVLVTRSDWIPQYDVTVARV